MENFENSEYYKLERIRKRVRAISGFYKHLAAYLLVNLFLLILKYRDLDAGESFFTFGTFSTVFFWGIGLVCHAISVFGNNVMFGKEWEERKIREFMERGKKEKWE